MRPREMDEKKQKFGQTERARADVYQEASWAVFTSPPGVASLKDSLYCLIEGLALLPH